MSPTTKLTIDDYEALPDELAEGHELVDGELVDVSGSNLQHNLVKALLFTQLSSIVWKRGLGTVLSEQGYDFDGNAYTPDVSFFGSAKQPLADRRKRVQRFVPDLAVEIVRPHELWTTVMCQRQRYRRCGTAEVWLVLPFGREVFVYSDCGDRILGDNEPLTTQVLPGFQMSVKKIFDTE